VCQPTLDEAESRSAATALVEGRSGRLRAVLVAGKIMVSVGLLAAVAAAADLGAIGDLVLRLQPLAVLATLCCLDLMPLPRGLLRVARPFFVLAADARKVLLAPLGSLILLALSVLSHLLTVGAVFVLAIGLGVGLDFTAALAAVPAIVLITFIPLSFAGWGLREGAAAVMLGFVGLAADEAVALSVLLGVATLIAGLPGLAFWLAGGRRRPANRSG